MLAQPEVMTPWTREKTAEVGRDLEGGGPEIILRWALSAFAPDIALATGFGAEGVLLIDMWWQINRHVPVFTLDTGRLPEETYELMDRIRKRYEIPIAAFFPDPGAVEALVQERGFHSFHQSVEERKSCCGARKVEPLRRALAPLRAWVTGLRRAQGPSRADITTVEWDAGHGLVKINPLARWTQQQVWDYIRMHRVPYNALHDRGYPSIGCAPCTRAIQPGEDIRAGRWWWEQNPVAKECGIHRGACAGLR